MSSTMTERHKFASVSAAMDFVAGLRAAGTSYSFSRLRRVKPGGPLYVVFVYG